jgi:Cft2 family RNA processing exonuclease
VQLVEVALAAVRSGGNVLIPVDTAGRVLELLLRLDVAWDDSYSIVFVNDLGPRTVRHAPICVSLAGDWVIANVAAAESSADRVCEDADGVVQPTAVKALRRLKNHAVCVSVRRATTRAATPCHCAALRDAPQRAVVARVH